MLRAITGFHRDDEGDWVAKLACGHNQHVRHRPPFQLRPWTQTPEGRADRLGTPLECPLCDRAELPDGLRHVRTSSEWTEQTVPRGLRRAHRLAAGTWGRIVVSEGVLRYSMTSEPPLVVELGGDGHPAEQAVPPDLEHEVEPIGPVRFTIDFLAVDRAVPSRSGSADRVAAPVDEGGDPACWAGQVCPECGIVIGDGDHRPGCSAVDPP